MFHRRPAGGIHLLSSWDVRFGGVVSEPAEARFMLPFPACLLTVACAESVTFEEVLLEASFTLVKNTERACLGSISIRIGLV